MIRTHRRNHLLHGTTLATCLSAGVLTLVGCVSRPVNTSARDSDASIHDPSITLGKDPAITPDTFYAAGQLAESEEQWDKAIAQYNKALKISKNHQPSLYRLGVIYAKFKQYPQAIVIWNRYLTATGGDPTAYANVGFCYELSGNFAEAENAYESGIRRDPNNAPCRVNYGLMLARRGRFNQAMHEWQAVLPPAEVYYNLGSAYEASDRKEQAKAEFHKALELDPQLADARARLERLGEKVPAFTPPPVAQVSEVPEPEVPTAPTTVPSESPAAAAPTTTESVAAVTPSPETRPVEQVEVPTTAPSEASTQAPTTQPVASTDTPTTAPSVASGQTPTTAPVTDTSTEQRPEVDVSEPGRD